MMPLFLATAISDSTPASVHGLLPGGILNLLDAAVRALLVACVVGAGLRIFAAATFRRRRLPGAWSWPARC